MINSFIKFIFFGNIFVGLLAIALSIETVIQLNLPYNSTAYYLFLFFSTMAYYTYAYAQATVSPNNHNPRTLWYLYHRRFVKWNLRSSLLISTLLCLYLTITNLNAIWHLPLFYWLILAVALLAGILYYGLVPKSFYQLNIRKTGLLKSFVIGFVWASCVNIFPLIWLKIQEHIGISDHLLVGWLFLKTFMFCTVNAIMFDIKDYAEDANRQLKTFVVRFGLRNTIFQILIPLLLIGTISIAVFAMYRHFSFTSLSINFLPFALSLLVAYSMHKRQNILYYLIVIDGLLLIKAICGIVAMQFA